MSVLAIIPARSGSKRLPGKNLKNFCGKPLLEWTLQQVPRIKEITHAVIATDYGGFVTDPGPHWSICGRPGYLAGDDVPMAHVVAHVLGQMTFWPELVVLLQPTSPTRTDETVRECIREALRDPTRTGAFTVRRNRGAHRSPNGACYAFPPSSLPPTCCLSGWPILTDDIDINEPADFEAAERVMRERLAK